MGHPVELLPILQMGKPRLKAKGMAHMHWGCTMARVFAPDSPNHNHQKNSGHAGNALFSERTEGLLSVHLTQMLTLKTQLVMLTQSASIHRKPSEGITLWSLGKDGEKEKTDASSDFKLKDTGLGLYFLHPTPPQVSVFFQFLINKALGDQSSHKTFPVSFLLPLTQ